MENRPGDGAVSPFGDEKGATVAGGGASSGAHDFLTDPASHAPQTGGRDFTKESRPQGGGAPEVAGNPQEIPAGGTLPFPSADPRGPSGADAGTVAGAAKHTPFRLGGE